MAAERARAARGTLVLRNEDLDRARTRPEFVSAFITDLHWLGLEWQEGPDIGGPAGPYDQSGRLPQYRAAFEQLRRLGQVYPCTCSRRDIESTLSAPHAADDEPVYPGTCRHRSTEPPPGSARVSWRFRVPDAVPIRFVDGAVGPQESVAGRDFGDFVVWRHDDLPSYQLACVVDDAAMGITEVVRGADLIRSTARQLLLYDAFGWVPPSFFHCPLMTDEHGVRLAKRHGALSLRSLREAGRDPSSLTGDWRLPVTGQP